MTPTTKQLAIDIDATPAGPELDALVMVEIMGWNDTGKVQDPHGLQGGFPFWKMPEGGPIMLIERAKAYSTDANHVREVEAEIERRELDFVYGEILKDVLKANRVFISIFAIATATPEQRCRAALRAVMA